MTAEVALSGASRGTRGPARRSDLRAVALPTEHGGWGLTAEPALLGLLVAPSVAGLCLGFAAMVAFLARTPLKMLLVDRWRGRHSERTGTARAVLAVEAVVLAALVATAAVTASSAPWWWPALVALPMVALELWFDMRSRGRRLLPELAGAVGIASVATMVALAGGASTTVAVGAWLILSARAVTSIPHVRHQIARLHGRAEGAGRSPGDDAAAVAIAAAASLADPAFLAGTLGVVGVVVAQRAIECGPVAAPKVIGFRQMAFGFALVAVTALGVHVL